MKHDNVEIIREFINAWSKLDAEELVTYFCEDGCYHNMPLDPVTGHENILDFINGFLTTWTDTEWEIKHIFGADNVVVAERVDKTRTTQGNVDLPCVGIFEMDQGKIRIWRDYFDMGTYTNAMTSS